MNQWFHPYVFLRGFGQVMLQNNAMTGLIFLIAILYNSIPMGLGAVAGCVVGTVTAVLLKYDRKDINNGLYGFNGVLVGIAAVAFFQITPMQHIVLVAGAALSTLVMHFMHTRQLMPYTFPFVISAWVMIGVVTVFSLIPFLSTDTAPIAALDIKTALTMGFSQVMLQANVVTGILFLIAIACSSRSAAVYACAGALLSMLLAVIMHLPVGLISMGLYGFNAVLCGIALEDRRTHQPLCAVAAIVLSVLIMHLMLSLNLIALTAPFVFATWITLMMKKQAARA